MNHSFSYKEGDLVPLLMQKNIPAFQQLYDRYAPALYSTILQIVRDRLVANKVLQKVFLTAWRNIESYDPSKKSLFTWMLNITRCSALEEMKTPHAVATARQSKQSCNPENQPATNAIFDNCGLKQVVEQLSEEEKSLIELCYYRGMSHEQITNTLDIPLMNVKPRLKTALSELRTLL